MVCAYDPGARACWIGFRGTDSFRDVVADLGVRKARPLLGVSDGPGARAKVHAGFNAQYRGLAAHVLQFVDSVAERGAESVELTGHSLGGALATLAALHVASARPALEVRCTAFGCPRVGDAAFAHAVISVTREVTRVTVGRDPVARVPTRARWRHAGRELRLPPPRSGRAPPAAPAPRGDPLWRILDLPSLFSVGDHDMGGYVSAVTAASDAWSS